MSITLISRIRDRLSFESRLLRGTNAAAGAGSLPAMSAAAGAGRTEFASDLRLSPRPVLGVVWVLALVILQLAETQSDPGIRSTIANLMLAICLLTALTWWLVGSQAWLARWCTIALLVGTIIVSPRWLPLPGFLALLSLPTALAAVMIDLPSATGVALAETALLLSAYFSLPGERLAATFTALSAVWGTVAVMQAVYRPVYSIAQWSWEHYRQAQDLLEETRERKAELEQALADLSQANHQLTRLNILAQGLRQAAEDARTAKEQFVANVSHELRTPLNMITGFSEMMLQSPETYGERIPAALLTDLTVIHRNARHLADLIDDVLDLSQLEADQMALSREEVSFREIVDAVTTAVRPLFQSKGLYLRTEVPAQLPPVSCDRTRIREVLLNLVSNAGRFTEQGGVEIRVEQEGQALRVAISDTGRGIAADAMGRIFQPFEQADDTIHRRYGGTGLGLSISKRFIELHGGTIGVESQEGIGTTFYFCLPLAPPAPLDGSHWRGLQPGWEYLQRAQASLAPPRMAPKPRFVVLESGNALQRLLGRYLDGVEIVPASDQAQALCELASTPSQALLINDLAPGDSLRQLDSLDLPAGVPALICSVPGVQEAAGAFGVTDYLVKPISRDALLACLDRLERPIKTVLIVDDQPEALRLFRRMLASAERSYRVLRASDGQQALALLRDERPDVLLLDLVMPHMDGYQLLAAKNADPSLKDIPAVITSARDPAGQPIISHSLAVTCQGGLSAPRLLACIKAFTEILVLGMPSSDPKPPVTQPG
jgi:signal transduction histidine kinase/CheY-like chemotaxis protein